MYLLIIAVIVLGVVLSGQPGATADFNFWAFLTDVILPNTIGWVSIIMGGYFLVGMAIAAAIGTLRIEEMYRWAKKPKTIALIVVYAVGLGGWLTWPPREKALDHSCRPAAFLSAASEGLHGKGFWRAQFDAFQRARILEEGEPARRAERDEYTARILREQSEQSARVLQDNLAKLPQLATRKSPAEREAEELRARADRIEEAERPQRIKQFFDDGHRRRIEWLLRCERVARENWR